MTPMSTKFSASRNCLVALSVARLASPSCQIVVVVGGKGQRNFLIARFYESAFSLRQILRPIGVNLDLDARCCTILCEIACKTRGRCDGRRSVVGPALRGILSEIGRQC